MHIQLVPPRPPPRCRIKVLILLSLVLRIGRRMRPELRTAQTNLGTRRRLVPKHLIHKRVALGIIVNHEALIVLRTLIHNLAKRVKIGEHARVLVIQLPPIVDDVLAQNKDVVDVRTEGRGDAHRILHRDDKHGMDVTTVHEEITYIPVADPRGVEQTVIENQEVAGIHDGRAPFADVLGNLLGNQLLTLEHIGDDQRRILLVDKHGGDELAVELIGALCAGDNRAAGKGLIVPQQILDQEGLAGFTLPDEHNDLVVLDFTHIEFPEFEIEALGTTAGL